MLTWAFGLYAAIILGHFVLVDVARPELRDPEYGLRLNALRQRIAEHPERPLVVVIGSSRTAMGVRPYVWEESRPGTPTDPLLFNMSRVGGGPLIQLMTLRRLYADGIRPDAVILEHWTPLLREDGPFAETARIEPERLFLADREFVQSYMPKPDTVERRMLVNRLNPLFTDRGRWLGRVARSWQRVRRVEVGCRELDGWGWLPGLDEEHPDAVARAGRLRHCEGTYRGHLNGFAIHADADRALRESVAVARSHGTRVAFAWLPESTEFRGWYPPEAERLGRDHLAGLCRELGVPLINARVWMPDAVLADGFHLTRDGAADFTRRFGPAVAEIFPDLAPRD